MLATYIKHVIHIMIYRIYIYKVVYLAIANERK